MAGLYSKTYRKKSTVSLAPDAIVRINGSVEVKICNTCNGTIFLSEYITNISSSLATNGTVGTASFTISMPKHGHESKYMIRKGRVYGLSLMDEVEIFIKGRFQKTNDNKNVYYKVFWGLIVNIQESYSDGFLNLSISCESILKWLQLMKTNEHPAAVFYTNSQSKAFDYGVAAWASKIFADMNPYEIVVSLLQATYRNIVLPDALDTERLNLSAAIGNFEPPLFFPEDIDLMEYWNRRFETLTQSLKIFGAKKENIIKSVNKTISGDNANDTTKNKVATDSLTPFKVFYDNTQLADFRPFFKRDDARANPSYSASSYKSNLEIINEVKLYTGFEFYLDTNGDIIFKPPFWNLDTKRNPIFVLKDNDILSYDFSDDANQVVTRVDVTGEIFYEDKTNSDLSPRATFTDWSLARQYGIVEELIPARFAQSESMCFFHAISELDRINSNKYTGSVTIVGRPEIRLGYPVYIESRDLFGYVDNISHNFTFGGTYTTQIELTAIRKRYKLPNRILVASNKNKDLTPFPSLQQSRQASFVLNGFFDSNRRYKTNRNTAYEEKDAFSKEGLDISIALNDAKRKGDADKYLNILEKYIPVSDSEGYELIGNYENGKRFYLTSKYTLEVKNFYNKLEKDSKSIPRTPDNTKNEYKNYVLAPEFANDPNYTNPDVNSTAAIPDETNTLDENIISNFSKTTAFYASQLSPKDDGGKGCSCSMPESSFKIKREITKKTMDNLNKR